ncbi:MAG: hypothetical protein RKL32_01780 [Gammaproteobacteria bacterium]
MPPPTFTFSARRRLLLGGAAAVLIGGIELVCTLPSAAAAPSAADLGVFDDAAARTLLAACRTLFPHAALGDAPYFECVRGIDSAARADAGYRALIGDALARLPADFAGADQAAREAALHRLDGTPAFQALRGAAGKLYRNPAVWPHFDYPGPSLGFGGWVDREILDLDWLPPAKRQLAAGTPS